MRHVELVIALGFTAGCAQILGVDEAWERPGAGGGSSTSTVGGPGAGGPGAGGAGGLGAGGAPECIDTDKDPENCGACGRTCLGGDCSDGVCQPATIFEKDLTAAEVTATACNLAVKDAHVYLAVSTNPLGEGVVVRLDKDGSQPGEAKVLSTKQRSPFGLAADDEPDGFLYFVNRAPNMDGSVARVKKNGGSLQLIADNLAPAYFLVRRSGRFFFTMSDHGELREFDEDSLEPKPLEGAKAAAVQVDEEYVYWTDKGFHQIRKRALPGGTFGTLGETDPGLSRLAIGEKTLFFSTVGAEATSIKAIATGGGTASLLWEETEGVWSLAADATHVYWTTHDPTSNHVYRMAVDGKSSEPEPLANDVEGMPVVTLDEDAAYWCAFEGRKVSVRRIAK